MSGEIVSAVKTVTDHAREFSHILGWDSHYQPTDAEIKQRQDGVLSVCDEMDALAAVPDSSFRDFEKLRQSIGADFPLGPSEQLQAVAAAFYAAGRM